MNGPQWRQLRKDNRFHLSSIHWWANYANRWMNPAEIASEISKKKKNDQPQSLLSNHDY